MTSQNAIGLNFIPACGQTGYNPSKYSKKVNGGNSSDNINYNSLENRSLWKIIDVGSTIIGKFDFHTLRRFTRFSRIVLGGKNGTRNNRI